MAFTNFVQHLLELNGYKNLLVYPLKECPIFGYYVAKIIFKKHFSLPG